MIYSVTLQYAKGGSFKLWAELLTERDVVKYRSREIGSLNYHIALEFDRHVGSTAAEVPVKFQGDRTILNTNLAASRIYEILQ